MKHEAFIKKLESIRDMWMRKDLRIANIFAALYDQEINMITAYNLINDVIAEEPERGSLAMDCLFSIIVESGHKGNLLISQTDDGALNEYYIHLICHPTGTALKMGVKDASSMNVFHSEMLNTDHIYTQTKKQIYYLADGNEPISFVLLNAFYSSLLSILQLCLENSKQHSATAVS